MKVKVNLLEALTKAWGDSPTIPATIGVGEVFEFMDTDHEQEIDIHELLAEQKAIALIWDTDQLRSHYEHLTEKQAWEVLQECERHYKGEEGLTWDDIAETVTEMYPEPRIVRRWHGHLDVTITDADGCGSNKALNRMRDMAAELSDGMPDVEAEVDADSIYATDE